ncbi:hypothetical protein FHX73_11687 [Kitasatospora viridis]|uniref:Uncharacterized protein n=1 Tax=Kitasatospora viridis TaxID=281105 RepID=A0A561UC28_9ACTN|nr:hypothetical protein FHX73_11687 [Kitasatospora viridis]
MTTATMKHKGDAKPPPKHAGQPAKENPPQQPSK